MKTSIQIRSSLNGKQVYGKITEIEQKEMTIAADTIVGEILVHYRIFSWDPGKYMRRNGELIEFGLLTAMEGVAKVHEFADALWKARDEIKASYHHFASDDMKMRNRCEVYLRIVRSEKKNFKEDLITEKEYKSVLHCKRLLDKELYQFEYNYVSDLLGRENMGVVNMTKVLQIIKQIADGKLDFIEEKCDEIQS